MSGTNNDAGNAAQDEPDEAAQQAFAERIEAQRTQISRAMSIIEACRMGSDSMLAPLCGAEDPGFGDALAAAYDLLGDVVDELETIGGVKIEAAADQGTS